MVTNSKRDASVNPNGVQDEDEVLVYTNRYLPDVDFDVVTQFEPETARTLLEDVDGVSQPEDWDGYLIQYDVGGTAGVMTLLFQRESELEVDDSESLADDAAIFSSGDNLLEVSLD